MGMHNLCRWTMLYVTDKWLIIDEDIPPLDFLVIEGGLSAAPNSSLSFTLDVNYILISGRLAIGWENDPFNGTAKIILRGEHSTPAYSASNGPELGAKFIGMYPPVIHCKMPGCTLSQPPCVVSGSTLLVPPHVFLPHVFMPFVAFTIDHLPCLMSLCHL